MLDYVKGSVSCVWWTVCGGHPSPGGQALQNCYKAVMPLKYRESCEGKLVKGSSLPIIDTFLIYV